MVKTDILVWLSTNHLLSKILLYIWPRSVKERSENYFDKSKEVFYSQDGLWKIKPGYHFQLISHLRLFQFFTTIYEFVIIVFIIKICARINILNVRLHLLSVNIKLENQSSFLENFFQIAFKLFCFAPI